MDFGFTPEQDLLRKTARDFAARVTTPAYVREHLGDARGMREADWRQLAALGWIGLGIAEDAGGSGLGALELAIVLEELGRAVAPGPLLSTVVAARARAARGDGALLRALCAGDAVATLAWQEDGAGWDPASTRTTVVGATLDGTKRYVPHAAAADVVVCLARRGGGFVVAPVARDAAGVVITAAASVDETRPLFEVRFDRVELAPDGFAPLDAAAVTRILDEARIAYAADMCGGAERVLELTVEYAKVRRQFGQPIGSFQAIQHECADMQVQVELAKMATYAAAAASAAAAPDASLAAAMAKAAAGDAYRAVTAQAIQIHGGIGFTWEHDLHLYFKRALSGDLSFGDATWCRELVAQRLGL